MLAVGFAWEGVRVDAAGMRSRLAWVREASPL